MHRFVNVNGTVFSNALEMGDVVIRALHINVQRYQVTSPLVCYLVYYALEHSHKQQSNFKNY